MQYLTQKYTLYIRASVTLAEFKIMNKCTHYYEGMINIIIVWKKKHNQGLDQIMDYLSVQ